MSDELPNNELTFCFSITIYGTCARWIEDLEEKHVHPGIIYVNCFFFAILQWSAQR